LTFDVGEHHVEFGLFNDVKPSATFACCGCHTIDLDEPVDLPDLTLNDPSSFSCPLYEGLRLDDDEVNSFPPSIVETESYAVDKGYLSACCWLTSLWMSMPQMSGGVQEIDVNFNFEFGPYDGDGPKVSVILDPTLWSILRAQKDLNPELLRWFLLLTQFDFEVRYKG